MYRNSQRVSYQSDGQFGDVSQTAGWEEVVGQELPDTEQLSRLVVEQDALDRISGPKRISNQQRVGADYVSVSDKPFSDANYLSPEVIAARFRRGSRDTQQQFLDLIRFMFDPTTPFFISANNNENTTTQMQNLNQTFNALIMPNGTPRSRAFVVRPIWDVTPIQSLASVPQNSTFFYDASTPAQTTASRISPPLAYNATFFPTLTVVSDFFVPEVSVELKVSPNMDVNFTRGRLNSFQFMVIGNQLSVNTSVLGGQLSYGVIPDIRDCMDLEPTKLQSMSVSDKDAANNVFLSDGVAIIQGPTFAKLDPVNMRRVGGDGYSAVAANVLTQPVPFKQTAYQEIASAPFPTVGAAYAPNSAVASAANNQFVYTGAIWLHNQVRFSLSSDTTTVTNIQIPQIGYDNNPEFTVTYRLPASTGESIFDYTPTLNAEMMSSPQPFTLSCKHFFMQARGTDTVVEWVPDKYDCPLTNACQNEGLVAIPSMWQSNTTLGTGSGALGYVGATATSTYTFSVPRRDNWQWIGTMIQGIDQTVYPVAFAGGYPGYPTTTTPVGATISPISVWTPGLWQTVPFFRVRAPGPGVMGNPANFTAYPWWAIGDQSRLSDFRPTILGIAVNVPRLYDEGNLGPYRVVRIDNVSTGQTFTINGALQTEVVTTGSTAQFKKADNASVITDDNVIGFAQMLFSAKGINFKTMYKAPEFAQFKLLIESLKRPEDLLRLPFWTDPRVNIRAATIGLLDNDPKAFGPFAGVASALLSQPQLRQIAAQVMKQVLPVLTEKTAGLVDSAAEKLEGIVGSAGSDVLRSIGKAGTSTLGAIAGAAADSLSSGAQYGGKRRAAIKSSRCEEVDDEDSAGMFGANSAGMFGANGSVATDECAGMFGAGMFGTESAGMFGADARAAAAFSYQTGIDGLPSRVRTKRGANPGLLPGQMMSQAALISKINRIRTYLIRQGQAVDSIPAVSTYNVSLGDRGLRIVQQAVIDNSIKKGGWNYVVPMLKPEDVAVFINFLAKLGVGDAKATKNNIVPIVNGESLSRYYKALQRSGMEIPDRSVQRAINDIDALGRIPVEYVAVRSQSPYERSGVASFAGLSRFIWWGFVGFRSARLLSLADLAQPGMQKYSFLSKFVTLDASTFNALVKKTTRAFPNFLTNPVSPLDSADWAKIFPADAAADSAEPSDTAVAETAKTANAVVQGRQLDAEDAKLFATQRRTEGGAVAARPDEEPAEGDTT